MIYKQFFESPIFTIHPNGTKFSYLTDGLVVRVGRRLNADGKTYDDRNSFLYKIRGGKPGVLIEYPDGVRRFISNFWYE